jgi:transposase-like protein
MPTSSSKNYTAKIREEKRQARSAASQRDAMLERQGVFLAAFKGNGKIAAAAKAAGINKGTAYAWIRQYPEFAEVLSEIKEQRLDLAEAQLEKNVRAGKEKSIFFMLERQGRHRGWGAKTEIDLKTSIVVTLKPREGTSGA